MKNESANSDKFNRYVVRFRKKYIPKRYNQILLMDYLQDPKVFHLISISNRADGKSNNYIHFAMRMSIDFTVGFTIVARHWTVQKSYVRVLIEICREFSDLDESSIFFRNSDFYIRVLYKVEGKDKEIGIITDFTQVSDLKNESAFMSNFPFIIIDEFLVLEQEYFSDEYDRLSLLYSTINRKPKDSIPIIGNPKVLYLGNAINFSSPILLGLNLFNKIEKQPLNTVYKYGKVVLEMFKNEQANNDRATDAFDEENNDLANVVFSHNDYLIVSDAERDYLTFYGNKVIVKLKEKYLFIYYNIDRQLYMLSIRGFSKTYDFNMFPKDNTETSIYIKPSYYDEIYKNRFLKGKFKFDNVYSRYHVMTDGYLITLNIKKICRKDFARFKSEKEENKEAKFKDNYIEQTKRGMLRRWFF